MGNITGIGFLVLSLLQGMEYERTLGLAKEAFYNERYAEADALALKARGILPREPESYELRTTVLLFRLKRELGVNGQKANRAGISHCAACPGLLVAFEEDLRAGIREAERLRGDIRHRNRADFFLAKLRLNRIWLNLQVLDQKRGLGDYRDARHRLQEILAREPDHIRAVTAFAWIDYIVGDRNYVFRKLLGGGDKDRAMASLYRALVLCEEGGRNEFDCAEARFGLLEILKSEGRTGEERILAKKLFQRFPGNSGLARRTKER